MRRKIVLLVVSLSLFFGLFAVFINLTEVDIVLRQLLRGFVPEAWQDALRPLRAPMVLGFSPDWEATNVTLRSPVSITFLTPMNPSWTESSLHIQPSVEGEFSWRGRTLVFTPTEDWPMQTGVTVTVTREARSWLLRRMEREFSFRFTTLGPPLVTATEPAQDARYVYPQDRLTITFNRPMNRESVESRLHVSPEISRQRLAWRDEQLIISGVLRSSTEYRIVIARGAKDTTYELETPEDFEWSFTTTERHPYLAVTKTGGEALVNAGVPVGLQLSVVNVSRVDLDLYAIDISTYISMTNFSYDDWQHFEPQAEPMRSWSMDPEATLDRDESRALELEGLEPGLYLLTAESPEGAQDSQMLVSTHTALAMKRTAQQVLVWATSLQDGQPVAGLELTIYDGEGKVVADGQSDGDAILSVDIPDTDGALHVVSKREQDVSLCSDDWRNGIEPWRFENVLWRWEPTAAEYRLFVYTDRPLYRPGESVYFKGILRRDEGGEYVLPEVRTPVRVIVENYKNDVLCEQTLETNAFGSIHGHFDLNEEVELGGYSIEARVDDEEWETAFRIEEHPEAAFNVSVRTDRDSYINGDVISATISANHHFGVPVAGASLRYTLYSSDFQLFSGDGQADLDTFPLSRYGGYGREVASGEGVIDEDGKAEILLQADITREGKSQIFTLEATVSDRSGEQVSSVVSFPVHRGEFNVELRPEGYVVPSGHWAAVNVQTMDTEGTPLADVALSYAASLIEWHKVRHTPDERTYWDWQEVVTELEASSITTDREGEARIAFVVPRGGIYRLQTQGRDSRGNWVVDSVDLWVGDVGRRVAWRYEEHDRIELVTDKAAYHPGETANVLVQSPYDQATALVTVERGCIMSHFLVDMETNSAVVEIPVKAEYFPNVFVSVILAPSEASDREPPAFKMGYAEVKVESPEKELRISVLPNRQEYQPGQMATYTVRTRDYMNRPVSAEVSVGVMEASIYASAGDSTHDIVEAFYGRRELGVRTAHSLTVHVDRVRLVEDYGGGGGVGEQAAEHIFLDVAYWNPAVVTDENGLARVEFAMPDKLTTWRAFAAGVTVDGRVGAAHNYTVSAKDLVLRPNLPRFLSTGDQAVIGAVAENHTRGALEAQVSLTATNLLLPPSLSHTVVISQDQAINIDWALEAAQAGSSTLTMLVESPTARDVVQSTLPILPFGERGFLVDALTVEEEEARPIVSVPTDARSPTLDIHLSPSLAAALIDSLEYLTSYPHGCVEQTTSRFLPGLLVTRALGEMDLENQSLGEELPARVESGLQRLYRFQHYDGGWGWCEDDESQPYQTAYTVYGLSEARKAGHEVNEEVVRRGVQYLQQALLETHDLDLRAYISYVLAEHGEGDLSLARSLFERRQRMNLGAQAYLALALDNLGASQEAKSLVDELAREAVETAHTIHWQEKDHDWAAMSSDGHTTATILQAMLAADPENPLVPKTVRWLLWTRSGGHWRTTKETSAAIIALSEYMALGGQAEADFSYQVFLNGELIAGDVVTEERITEHRELEVADLIPGDNEIRVVKEGDGQLHLATTLRYYADTQGLETARSLMGPLVKRRYEHVQSGEPLTHCQLGDLIQVSLTVELPEDMGYVIVEDPLPAGTKAVNGTLDVVALGDEHARDHRVHSEMQDEKAVFFATYLRKGTYEFAYLIRATTAGSFRAMPTEVMLMYDPDVWGRSTSAILRVEG